MKKQKKNNNKGFSLVELIVVVLIMAIIAIALAPAVMKWVDNSRIATDVQTYDGMYADAQLAMVNKEALAAVKNAGSEVYTIVISESESKIFKGSSEMGDTDAVHKAMTSVDPSWATAKAKVSGASYIIEFTADGAVKKTANAPDTSPNDDLK